MSKSLKIKNLSVSYGENNVLRDINFSIKTGNLVGIVGPNGAGKSTLIKAILKLIPADSGKVEFCQEPLNKVRKKIAYKPQSSQIDWDFPIKVKDTVILGTYPQLGLFKRPGKKEEIKAMECLEKVGMESYAERQINELSGGQQQRVFLARALAQDAECFFLDEPFVGIDAASEKIMVATLKDLRDKGKTIFVVHHDLMKVKDYFDQLILLNKDLIAAGSVKEVFRPKIMEKAYQASLSLPQDWEVN